MRNPLVKLGLLVLIIALPAVYLSRRPETQAPQEGAEPLRAVRVSVQASPVDLASVMPSSSPSVAVTAPKMDVAHPPKVSELREEVKKNVHEVPPWLLSFSMQVAKRMELAKTSEPEASRLMRDLETCTHPAQPDDSPVQAQALCLVTARELSSWWPGLKGQADQITENADPVAVRLSSRLGRVGH